MYIQLATSTLFKLCVQTVASHTPNGPIQIFAFWPSPLLVLVAAEHMVRHLGLPLQVAIKDDVLLLLHSKHKEDVLVDVVYWHLLDDDKNKMLPFVPPPSSIRDTARDPL